MHYRIVNLSFNASTKNEMLSHTETLRDEMKAIEGVQSVEFVEVGEGKAIGLACYDTMENLEAATPKDNLVSAI